MPNANVITYQKGYAVWEPFYIKLFRPALNLKLPIKMEQTECSEMSAYKIEDAGGSLKRKNTTIIKSFSKTELFQRTCGPLDCQT